jgi:predicted GIY-YIG superfamily endonuclease
MVSRASDRRERVEGHLFFWISIREKTLALAGRSTRFARPGLRFSKTHGGLPVHFADLMVRYVYILRCADGSFYVGSAQNLAARLKAHNDGRGATYTFKRRPVHLVYSEVFRTETEAVTRERQLKRWSQGKKEALIAGDLERLRYRSKRRSQKSSALSRPRATYRRSPR